MVGVYCRPCSWKIALQTRSVEPRMRSERRSTGVSARCPLWGLGLEAVGILPRRRAAAAGQQRPAAIEQRQRDDRDDDAAQAEAAGDQRDQQAENPAASTKAAPATAALDLVIAAFAFVVEAHGRSLLVWLAG